MAEITVFKGRDKIMSKELKGKKVFIGRQEYADIFLDNIMVSRKHAIIVSEGTGWSIVDESGKNGVCINGEVKQSHKLQDGDKIEIGKFLLVFSSTTSILSPEPESDDAASKEEESKRALPPRPKHTEVDTIAATLQLSNEQLSSIRKEMGAKRGVHLAAVTSMLHSTYPLDKQTETIGKSKDASINVPGGLTIGKIHAKISKYGEHWFVEHLSGLSGTKVNGKKITTAHRLAEGDEIVIGPHKWKLVKEAETHPSRKG